MCLYPDILVILPVGHRAGCLNIGCHIARLLAMAELLEDSICGNGGEAE